MASTRILSIIGRKNAGKTTLTVALASELARRGRRVMTIKHTHHTPEVDRTGTDSYRHFQEGRAERTVLVAPDLRVVFDRGPRGSGGSCPSPPDPPPVRDGCA